MTTQRGDFSFDDILPRLVNAYEAGLLVPFIGVGMSRPHCADWTSLIVGLEGAAGIAPAPNDAVQQPEDLIRRANAAARRLRTAAPGRFEAALRSALIARPDTVPEQTGALARIWWPLVLTTNYDNFFAKAFADEFGAPGLAVVGRGAEDCQRVLTSLNTAGRSLLWALQGFLAAPFALPGPLAPRRLSQELVLDHAEYRRVTHREPHFRRAFAEVFRHRSLLFLGSGLRETYLQELFGEVLELYGPSPLTHFAIMPRGEVDPAFLYARFQIAVVEYEPGPAGHAEVPRLLSSLHAALEQPLAAPTSRGWGRTTTRQQTATSNRNDFEVFRGPLPRQRREGECLVISAGGRRNGDRFFISSAMQPTLDAWCEGETPPPKLRSSFVAEYEGRNAFAVRARRETDDTKDLLQVRAAALSLFDLAAARFKCLHMQLLASGGDDREDAQQPRYSLRVFPARFAFIEMARAWGQWRRSHPDIDCCLCVHLVDASVYREIQSGRIDVLELLLCQDVCLWAEIIEGETLVERRQFKKNETTSVGTIIDELGLSQSGWEVEVSPLSGIDEAEGRIALNGCCSDGRANTARSLRELGVVHGSTLHFRRIEAAPSNAGPSVPS
jgi:hypothetical protein